MPRRATLTPSEQEQLAWEDWDDFDLPELTPEEREELEAAIEDARRGMGDVPTEPIGNPFAAQDLIDSATGEGSSLPNWLMSLLGIGLVAQQVRSGRGGAAGPGRVRNFFRGAKNRMQGQPAWKGKPMGSVGIQKQTTANRLRGAFGGGRGGGARGGGWRMPGWLPWVLLGGALPLSRMAREETEGWRKFLDPDYIDTAERMMRKEAQLALSNSYQQYLWGRELEKDKMLHEDKRAARNIEVSVMEQMARDEDLRRTQELQAQMALMDRYNESTKEYLRGVSDVIRMAGG